MNNEADYHSQSRKVAVYSPYWLINETGVPLSARRGALAAPVTCAPMVAGSPSHVPVLFSPPRGMADVSFGVQASSLGQRVRGRQGFWSADVPLVSVGPYSTSILVTAERRKGDAAPGAADPGDDHGRLAALSESLAGVHAAGDEPPADAGGGRASRPTAFCGLFRGARSEAQLRVELGISVASAPSVFCHTKVIRIVPRFLIRNATGRALQVKQLGCTVPRTLADGSSGPILWFDAVQRPELVVRLAEGGWHWSGGFRVDEAGELGLRLRQKRGSEREVLHVCVSLVDAAVVVAVSRDPATPPYRLENQCANISIRYKQRDLPGIEMYDKLDPKQSVSFAWDQPTLPHRLKVRAPLFPSPSLLSDNVGIFPSQNALCLVFLSLLDHVLPSSLSLSLSLTFSSVPPTDRALSFYVPSLHLLLYYV